ncbi:hypothetical protein K402DRAFT_340875 [Aulographum hederae CBS 113979]|uniref:Cytokinesis regulator n=1 Tax=Aulographum hederae CBS 113979 TaxID=1176131 RepID=A0A6G1GN54_9PEZI|nr:hypothetical protein K402DRAFT_340875 [Aulographum hederae CBS 113979]
MAASAVENWDEDADFQGDLFSNSLSTVQTGFSSRISIHSESNAGEEDNWQVLITPNDDKSTESAISSAKQAGIPIPQNVPSSALLGGTIKRLGKKKSRPKIDDDWGDDIELPAPTSGGTGLTLKPRPSQNALRPPNTPTNVDEDFDLDWAEGSLGVRHGGTKRDNKGRSSSVSAMSPSMGSVGTLESEDDGLDGLVLPSDALDFNAMLQKRKDAYQESRPSSPAPAPASSPSAPDRHDLQLDLSDQQERPEKPALETPNTVVDEDFLDDLDFGAGELFDPKKGTVNRNIKITANKIHVPVSRTPTTTLTFTDKPVSRIPRPAGPVAGKSSNLAPVYEPGAPQNNSGRISRLAPTTTSSQLLRQKRSAPVLRSNPLSNARQQAPFLPAGISNFQSHHITAKSSSQNLRRDSNPMNQFDRPMSPPARSFSRMSAIPQPDTPSRAGFRKEFAPATLLREALSKRNVIKPARKRNFGDGSELEIFDDLPTSATKESKFTKTPAQRGPPKTLRQQPSQSRLGMYDRSTTPLPTTSQTMFPPPTPRGLARVSENTPHFARDTAASRIAREQRIAGNSLQPLRPRGEGPLMPVTVNWKAQVAARSPNLSPTAQRGKKRGEGKLPFLIKQMGTSNVKNEKGMTYNPSLQRWEGNENCLTAFQNPSTSTLPLHPTHDADHSRHHHTKSIPNLSSFQLPDRQPSPPRATPALISHISTGRGVQVERGMVFDPRQMKWLKLDPRSMAMHNADPMFSPGSISVEEEEDPFAGLDDLQDENARPETRPSSIIGPNSTGGTPGGGGSGIDDWAVGEEFDLGPAFIQRQRNEEAFSKTRVDKWFDNLEDQRAYYQQYWAYTIREQAVEWEEARLSRGSSGVIC